MPRIRSIHPDACESHTLAGLDAETERTWWRLLTHCDDYGRMRADPALVTSRCYAVMRHVRPEDVAAHLHTLAQHGLVYFYQDGRRYYLQVVSWDEYQHPKNPGRPQYPDPAECEKLPPEAVAPATATTTPGLPQEYPTPTPGLDQEEPRTNARRQEGETGGRRQEGEWESGDALASQHSPNPDKRDYLFEAVTDACGWDRDQLTKSARGNANKATKELRQIGATPDAVYHRAAEHRQRWPGCDVTPTSLAKHWGQLATPRPVNAARDGPAMGAIYDQAAEQARAQGR